MGIKTIIETESFENIIRPGNIIAKINYIKLEKHQTKENTYIISLYLETQEDPENNFIVKSGIVRANLYNFSDKISPSGYMFSKEREIIKFLRNLFTELDVIDWLNEQDNVHETLESLFDQMNKDMPYKNIFLNWCICGRKYYQNDNEYYFLYLPSYDKINRPFTNLNRTKYNLIQFDESIHIINGEYKDAIEPKLTIIKNQNEDFNFELK